MRLERIVIAFLVAPLVTPVVILLGASRGTAILPQNVSAVFLLVGAFAYLAAFIFGFPAFLVYRRLRWTHPLLYLLGGGLIGFLFSLTLDWAFSSSTVGMKYRVLAGALSALVFRLIAGEITPATKINKQTIREPARVLFHLNGYTKVLLERTEGVGMADGGIVWDISTESIPSHLRKIGSRFIVQYITLSPEETNDIDAIRGAKNRVEIQELSEA